MSTITRPIKSGGTSQYRTEVEAGFNVIKATEVDGDLDPLYGTINALDDANIAPGANIHGSKIALGTLPSSAIGPGSITNTQISNTANIQGSKLMAGSVTARELATDAVLRQVASVVPPQGLDIATVEATAVTFPTVTLHATSYVILFGHWSLLLHQTAAGGFPGYDMRIKRNGSEIYRVTSSMNLMEVGDTSPRMTPLPVPTFVHLIAPAGAATYTITYVTGGAGLHVISPADPDTGRLYLMEFAGAP